MIYNYLKIALRNLLKYRFISFINLFGLTVGFTCCLLIFTYLLNELSYDRSNTDSERIYRVSRLFRNAETGATNLNLGAVAPAFGPLLLNDFKQIEKMTRVLPAGNTSMLYQEKLFTERDVYFADEHLFDFFNTPVIKGDGPRTLGQPMQVMLSEEMAKKYFGNEDPVNKIISIDNSINAKVGGVFKSFAANSHFHPAVLVSFSTLNDTAVYGEERLRTNWDNNAFFTYVRLPAGYHPQQLEAQFPAFQERHMGKNTSKWSVLNLQKLTDIHLRSHLDGELEENGDIKRVYIFSAIAIFILLIACINYMNLATARSVLRAREIGVRKAIGAQRKEIIIQFLSESVLIAFAASLLAMGITALTLPLLNQLTDQALSLQSLLKVYILLPMLLVPFVVGLLSGIYPALFMSSFRPVLVLKGLFKASGANISFRKVLVTLQFSISIILIISTAIVFRQLRFMQQRNLGFNKDHIIAIQYNNALNGRFETFRNELFARNAIKNAARSSRIPSGRLLDAMGSFINRGDSIVPTHADIKYVSADADFIATYGIQVLAGRSFSKNYGTDTAAYLLNEAAVKVLGLPSNEAVVDKDFTYGDKKGKIIGVIKNFHFESMHQAIVPLVLLMPERESSYGRISIKLAGADMPDALAYIESVWKKMLPETPFSYTFLDENFYKLYKAEQQQGILFTVFACIAIFIACLGLLGLSAFTISQRLKEIGIRKVLGASVGGIVQLLTKDFLKLVLLAGLIAFPVAWYSMHTWLQDFAYRTTIPWWLFLLAGVLAAGVAFFTISLQSIKAARSNPVKNLRAE